MANQHLPLLESGALAAAVILTASLAALPAFGSASESDQGIHDGLSLLRGALFRLELEAGSEALVAIEDGATLASRLAPRPGLAGSVARAQNLAPRICGIHPGSLRRWSGARHGKARA